VQPIVLLDDVEPCFVNLFGAYFSGLTSSSVLSLHLIENLHMTVCPSLEVVASVHHDLLVGAGVRALEASTIAVPPHALAISVLSVSCSWSDINYARLACAGINFRYVSSLVSQLSMHRNICVR
jgi:hypothetical protein